MRRVIVVFLICVGCLVSSGCMFMADSGGPHGLPHPHSELTAPTFCLYEGVFRLESERHKKPAPINYIRVYRHTKINDEPIDWSKWMEYADIRPRTDQVAWEIEYTPDGKSKPFHPFSCLTYGKAPKGYIEHIAAQPLIPERLYRVQILPKGITPMAWVFFVIRADSTGRETHLEYRLGKGTDNVYVIEKDGRVQPLKPVSK